MSCMEGLTTSIFRTSSKYAQIAVDANQQPIPVAIKIQKERTRPRVQKTGTVKAAVTSPNSTSWAMSPKAVRANDGGTTSVTAAYTSPTPTADQVSHFEYLGTSIIFKSPN